MADRTTAARTVRTTLGPRTAPAPARGDRRSRARGARGAWSRGSDPIEICIGLAARLRDLGFGRAAAVVVVDGASAVLVVADAGGEQVVDLSGQQGDLEVGSARTRGFHQVSQSQIDPALAARLPAAERLVMSRLAIGGRHLGYVLVEVERRPPEREVMTAAAEAVDQAARALARPGVLDELDDRVRLAVVLASVVLAPQPEPEPETPTELTDPRGAADGSGPDRVRTVAYAALAVVAVATPVVMATGPSGLRAALGFVAVLLVPGAALVGFFELADRGDELVLALGASIAFAVLAAELLLAVGVWHPKALALGAAAAAVPLARHARRSAQGTWGSRRPVPSKA